MKPFDNQGVELDSIFSLERGGNGELYLILESRGGGKGASGLARNPNYEVGLELLLQRLGAQNVILKGVEVYSLKTQNLSSAERSVKASSYSFPLQLSPLIDVKRFRIELRREVAAFGRPLGAKPTGNGTKRLRLTLDWTTVDTKTTDELEQLLAAPDGTTNKAQTKTVSSYAALGAYLQTHRDQVEIRLKLSEINIILGSPLPKEARQHQFWATTAHHLSRRNQWLDAGFEAKYEKRTETVRFHKFATNPKLTNLVSNDMESTSDPVQLRRRSTDLLRILLDKSLPQSQTPPKGRSNVAKETGSIVRFVRDPRIIAWTLLQSQGACEACKKPAPFRNRKGDPFLEVHHMRPLSEGGPDKISNTIAACPNCHRHLHYGNDAEALRKSVISKVDRLRDYPKLL